MNKIKQLPILEAQKIAAGEVIDRPANVIKELIENSIDAKSDHIALYIEDGGRKLIKVVDNGCGMSTEDAHMSLKHYATSKINTVQDLSTVSTFGFRGEALSSISSVSKLTLITKEADSLSGIKLNVHAGKVLEESEYACNTGTEIIIEDLFFNVPARQKFLKSKETEWRAISQIFHAFCFSWPKIYFKLFSEDRLIYNCPKASGLLERLEQLYDRDLILQILDIDKKEERMSLSVSGAITDLNYNRYDRSQIFLFVNQRWVKNSKLCQAVIKGYQNILPKDKFPAGFIFINIDSSSIDVNIHPKKEEVQFLHPKIVENLITSAVKEKLENRVSQKLSNSYEKIFAPSNLLDNLSSNLDLPNNLIANLQSKQTNLNDLNSLIDKQDLYENNNLPSDTNYLDTKYLNTQYLDTKYLDQKNNFDDYLKDQQVILEQKIEFKILGQFNKTYIIIESEEGLVLVDQHAAHERIIYERIKKQFNNFATIKLLFPTLIELTRSDIDLISKYLEIFSKWGLVIEVISYNQLSVQETPVFLKNQPINNIIQDIIYLISQKDTDPQKMHDIISEKIHTQLSCTAAVKAGDILNLESMNEIISDLHRCQNRLTCPHLRPTVWSISHSDIKKKFKRDYKN